MAKSKVRTAAGKFLEGADEGQMSHETYEAIANPKTFKRGGKVKRGGLAKVHRGERVLTKAQQRRMKSKHKRSRRK